MLAPSDSEGEELFYAADEGSDLDDFIDFSDEDQVNHAPTNPIDEEVEDGVEEESEPEDRVTKLNKQLKPNEDYTLKVLKAHISILVTAVGGPDHTSPIQPPPYKLGPEALGCLKDIKRWLRSVDTNNDSFDVALAIYEVGLVVNDLIVILCDWEKKNSNKKNISISSYQNTLLHKISLVCLELLVQLTWPHELNKNLTENQKKNFNSLRKAQLVYKKNILSYQNGQTFKAVLRLALPALQQEKYERDARDSQILKLVVFFIRNVLYLEPADLTIIKKSNSKIGNYNNLPSNVSIDDISLSNVISCYSKNKVLKFLLTLASGLEKDFVADIYGPGILESISLLIKGVKVKDLLTLPSSTKPSSNEELSNQQNPIPLSASVSGLQLKDLLKEESKRKKQQSENMSSRHGRFGSLLSIKNDDSSSYVVSGQEALLNNHHTFEKLDKSKKWKAKTSFRYDSDKFVQTTPVILSGNASLLLNNFVEMLLSSGGFNNLVKCTATVFDNSSLSFSDTNTLSSIDQADRANYFATVAWFFEYKRERNNKFISSNKTPMDDEDPLDYGSVGEGLRDKNFVLIGRYMRESFGSKDWNSLHVALICLRELLLLSYSIFSNVSKKQLETNIDYDEENEEALDQKDLAEAIIRKLFSEADYVSLLHQIPHSAFKHSPDYLKVVVSVIHILLKSFENFANEDVKVYMRSKRRSKKKSLQEHEEIDLEDDLDESNLVIQERKLDFSKTEAKFFHKDIVTTHITFLSRFDDLNDTEIKMALSYFRKLFVVRKDFTGLYRLDFMFMLYRLRNGLPRLSSLRKSVDEFIHYFMKKFQPAFERFPNPIEILFPRFEELDTKSYLATGELYGDDIDYGNAEEGNNESREEPGYVEEWIPEPKKAKDLIFKEHLEREKQIETLVACLYQNEKEWLIIWVIKELKRILSDRVLDTSVDVLLPSPIIRRLLVNDGHLRLLLQELGFKLPEFQNEPTVLLRENNNSLLDTNIKLLEFVFDRVRNGERDPAVFDKLTNKKKSVEKKQKDPSKQRKRRQRRRRSNSDLEEEESLHSKLENRYDPLAKLKSKAMVSLSDDESDDEKENEFFQREEKLRNLLEESGGIVNAEQLEAFKKAWKDYEQTGTSTNEAASLFVTDNDLNDMTSPIKSFSKPIKPVLRPNSSDFEDSTAIRDSGSDSSPTSSPNSKKGSETMAASISNTESIEDNDEYERNSKKRRLPVSDSEDEETEANESTIANYISAEEDHNNEVPSKKKNRFVISDDDEDVD